MSIADFWSLPPQEQATILKQATPPLLYRGKYQHVYGCKGQDADAGKCWEKQHGYRPGDCSCPCHSDCGGEW